MEEMVKWLQEEASIIAIMGIGLYVLFKMYMKKDRDYKEQVAINIKLVEQSTQINTEVKNAVENLNDAIKSLTELLSASLFKKQ